MAGQASSTPKTIGAKIIAYSWIALGSFLVAVALKLFLQPAQLIDGGVVGISMICASIFGKQYLSYFLVVLSIPFVILAYKQVGKRFVIKMIAAVILLALFSYLLSGIPIFGATILEVIVFGGLALGIGGGLIIRMGGAIDGTEILAILINKKKGYTIGQIVFFFNIFIFAVAGVVERDWHPALQSFMTYIVAYKIMDTVIVGLDETKSVTIISTNPRHLSDLLVHELGLGVTLMYGRGGYTGEEKEIIYVIVERLQLSALKELIQREDPGAFIAVENLHEVISGKGDGTATRKRPSGKRKFLV
ncbi:MAG: YitT family protein [Parachlamydiales bacterium]